jgi:hypothetical protein
LARFSHKIHLKIITVHTKLGDECTITSALYLISITISYLLSNEINFSVEYAKISVILEQVNNQLICKITASRIGNSDAYLDKTVKRLYRCQS